MMRNENMQMYNHVEAMLGTIPNMCKDVAWHCLKVKLGECKATSNQLSLEIQCNHL